MYVKLTPIPVLCVLIGTLFMVGCIAPEPERPAGTLSVAALLLDPVYDTEVTLYGQVALLGELLCPCFELSSGGETVQVWYDLMVEDDGTERSAVSVEGIENGDWVFVRGELKSAGVHRAANDFWASSIKKSLEPLTYDEARAIAENSTCMQEGTLTDTYVHNEYTRTWWLDLEPFTEKEGCNPACVVSEDTRTAEINWRCTGLLPPESDVGNEIQQTVCVTGTGESMNLSEALQIATASECGTVGRITKNAFCNAVTGTWWLDLEPYTPHEGCNPACVVSITTKTAEVNWRCTGLLPPE